MKVRTIVKCATLVTAGMQLNACVVFVPLLESDYVPAHEASCPLSSSVTQYAQSRSSKVRVPSSARAVARPFSQGQVIQVSASGRAMESRKELPKSSVRLPARSKHPVKAPAKTRVDSLISQLAHANDVVRTHAATDLGMLGSRAQRAVVPLSNALEKDSSKWVRRAAVKALARIGTPEVLAPLTLALHDSNKYVAHSAKQALRRLRQSSRRFGPL